MQPAQGQKDRNPRSKIYPRRKHIRMQPFFPRLVEEVDCARCHTCSNEHIDRNCNSPGKGFHCAVVHDDLHIRLICKLLQIAIGPNPCQPERHKLDCTHKKNEAAHEQKEVDGLYREYDPDKELKNFHVKLSYCMVTTLPVRLNIF